MELIYTWAEVKELQDRLIELRKSICENWDEVQESEKRLAQMRRQVIPEVGMPCTTIYYSDRSAAVIKEVHGKKKKEVLVQECGTYNGERVFTYRSNGRWVSKGDSSRGWGCMLGMGYQHNYFDESF